jgi:hypothetical protein
MGTPEFSGWCPADGCPAAICGGPHHEHLCLNGDRVTAREGRQCPFCGTVSAPRPGDVACTMCDEQPATTAWIFPVCQDCFDDLTELQKDLEAEEAADPALAEAGRRVEESFARLREELGG